VLRGSFVPPVVEVIVQSIQTRRPKLAVGRQPVTQLGQQLGTDCALSLGRRSSGGAAGLVSEREGKPFSVGAFTG
jgi:hypothetical protein